MKLFITVVLCLWGPCGLCSSQRSENSHPQVITPLGSIQGSYDITVSGRRYEAYKGIPYAQPPTGNLRFEIAQKILPWTRVLMAKQFGSSCMQYDFISRDTAADKVSGSEDCLYLNIYTPVTDDSRRDVNNSFPVIFFIPGGAFLIGNGNYWGPKYLLDRNVTLVTFNYRLGPLGFLSTEDEIVPGNMGLKDQVIALRWVKDNIQSFGGDPSRITIIGHSAGGVSAHLQCLTNLTAGLFQGAISLSGTALNSWAQVEHPLEKARNLAGIVGCPTHNISCMINCLKTRPARQIVEAVSQSTGAAFHPSHSWGPSVEKGGREFTFIDRPAIAIIASGGVQNVPWITGVVSDEALFPASFYIANEDVFEPLNNNWETLAPYVLDYNDTIAETDKMQVARLIKKHYLGESAFSKSTINQTVQMMSDRMFLYASEIAAKSQARASHSPVYVYYFSYRGAHSSSEAFSGSNENFGVCHGDDLRYVLDSIFDPTTTPRDREMQGKLIDLWVSFATDGKPDMGIEWPRLTRLDTEEYSYLRIAGPEEIGMESAANFGQKCFWRTIGFQENIPVA